MKTRTRVAVILLLAATWEGGACGNGDDGGPAASDADSDSDTDGGTDTDGDGDTDADSDADGDTDGGWLRTEGNLILGPGDEIWHGRGVNIHDTRSCWACAAYPPEPGEVVRRIDEAIDVWGADFLRLDLESYAGDEGWAVQWQGVLDDPAYLEDVVGIVDHVGTRPGVYVLVSLWVDPSFSGMGWPTAGTIAVWEALAAAFAFDSHVLFGLCNEPEQNYDGALDDDVWAAMNDAVAAIRAVEDGLGAPRHVVAVQGTGGWSRFLDYYVDHPITAGGGENVAYEVHVYDPESEFEERFVSPAADLPVIIGEYGPAEGYMSMADAAALQAAAKAVDTPYLAWTFHPRCPPNLLVDNTGGGCGVDMDLEPTAWGTLVLEDLAADW